MLPLSIRAADFNRTRARLCGQRAESPNGTRVVQSKDSFYGSIAESPVGLSFKQVDSWKGRRQSQRDEAARLHGFRAIACAPGPCCTFCGIEFERGFRRAAIETHPSR